MVLPKIFMYYIIGMCIESTVHIRMEGEEMDYHRKKSVSDRRCCLLMFMMFMLPFCVSGCIIPKTDEDFQFDNAILDHLIQQNITNGNLYCNSGGGYDLTPQQSRDILKAMKPVTRIGNGTINYEKTGYSFSFQFGMDPAVFEILVDGDVLTIGFYNKIYSGGSAALFLEAIKPIIGSSSFNQQGPELHSADERVE